MCFSSTGTTVPCLEINFHSYYIDLNFIVNLYPHVRPAKQSINIEDNKLNRCTMTWGNKYANVCYVLPLIS
jgi:hypothetical protein